MPSRTVAAPHAPLPAADQANASQADPPGLTFSVSVSALQHLTEVLRRPVEFTLFTLLPSGVDDWNDAQIVTQSVNTGERRVLIGRGKEGQYVATGHLVYALEGTLLAVPFDVERLTVAPGPVPLVEDVAEARSLQSGTAHFSLSKAGTLVYLLAAERRSLEDLRTLVWVDRAGGQEPLPQEPRGYQEVRLSPDGTRLAVAISGENENRDVWVYDIGRDAFTRFTESVPPVVESQRQR